ncbi:hypothetical protein V2J09_007589 [Rumex salicifolius]
MAHEVTHITAGPWGGQYGCRWDDGAYCTIRQVVIASSAVIDSIRFEYDNKGHSIWSDKHGGSGGKLEKIILDYPSEFLVSISGCYGSFSEQEHVVVRSLFLESNRKKYGPFGITQGTSFSLPISRGKLVGFHGRSSWFLDSIGVYVKPSLHHTPAKMPAASVNYGKLEAVNKTMVASYGPWGGSGGTMFDDGVHTGVREVHLTRSGCLVSIQACYDQNSKAVWGEKNGGKGGLTKEKIVFDYPYELLTHITGYYASTILRGPTIVKSITFHTNMRSYGPFGDKQGIYFSSGLKQGVIIGFHGRNGYFIDGIGVHVLETIPALSLPKETGFWSRDAGKPKETGYSEPVPKDRDGGKPKETGYSEPVLKGRDGGKHKEIVYSEPVQWGRGKARETGSHEAGPGLGKPWDDGASYTGIRKILLTRGEAICSIQTEYDRNGQSVWSAQHGHGNNACTYIIKLNYPHETITNVSGYYGFVGGNEGAARVVRSLTFYTNVAKYGPFGEEIGTYFSSGKSGGKVVGFHGRSGEYLDAIGVHMQQQQQQQQQQQLMGNENSYQSVVDRQAMRVVLSKILV